MFKLLPVIATFALIAPAAIAQSPAQETSVTLAGKTVRVKYSAPSVRGRKIFGPGGLLSQDPTYPVWRAGANSATSFHTDADLDIGGLTVPKGDYTLYAEVSNPDAWQLVLSKQTGQWGLTYDAKQDLGRVKMTMSKPPALVEQYKVTLSSTGADAGALRLEWENHVAIVPIRVK
jgi:hypothetical protein